MWLTARWESRQFFPSSLAVLPWLLMVLYTSTFPQCSRLSAWFHVQNDFSWRCAKLRPDKEKKIEGAVLPSWSQNEAFLKKSYSIYHELGALSLHLQNHWTSAAYWNMWKYSCHMWFLRSVLAILTAASFVNIGTLSSFYVVKDKAADIFVIAKKSHEKTKMNKKNGSY